ncbi:unnamed protein product [Caenorhabditis bovis]|uniref:SWIM-type domain-containing protein n=1 Tax=Caenorhabditis bovis TaxID=2654633 RepID=A0A8S1EYQ2_9PELO|nr:unnamed protein product [Caenorhabditis bovis]
MSWPPDDERSFEDSERFEDDSQVSLDGSTDGSNQNWRDWSACPSSGEAIQPGLSCVVYRYQTPPERYSSASMSTVVAHKSDAVTTLAELAGKVCAEKWSFEQLEEMYHNICLARPGNLTLQMPSHTIPEKIFLSIIIHCFPTSPDDIRMYSTLANGTCDQFEFGSGIYQVGGVKDVSQTGFLLSANVLSACEENPNNRFPSSESQMSKDYFHVNVKVDRCKIVECTCECSLKSTWCRHVVALCLYRIRHKNTIKYNETIADAINSMSDYALRKLVQWHINEIPRKCIPGFQKLIDQIKDPKSEINQIDGAPDPTDGGHDPVPRYDFPDIADNIRKLLCKSCVPTPSVTCDVQYLSTTQHPTTVEWNSLIKPLRAREPEGMWNLLQMVREMLARNDNNSVALLRTITDECLTNTQVLLWWYETKLLQTGYWFQVTNSKMYAPTQTLAQFNCAQMCDEVVNLWRCVAMNPRATKDYRAQLAAYLENYHRTAVNRLRSVISGVTNEKLNQRNDATVLSNHQAQCMVQGIKNDDGQQLSSINMRFTLDCFPGFYPALQMCHYLCENSIDFGLPADAYFDVEAPNLSITVKMEAPKLRRSKKKKRRSRNHRRRYDEADDFADPILDPYQRQVFRVFKDRDENQRNEESTESGQESDVVQQQQQQQPCSSRGVTDLVEMDVNEVLAAAFWPLDPNETRFLKCEAYATHGYKDEAIERATNLIDYISESLKEQSEALKPPGKMQESFTKFSLSQDDKDSTSTDSDRVSNENSFVAKCNRFLATLERCLYIAKVLRNAPGTYKKVFEFLLNGLAAHWFPVMTKHQQIKIYYYETEFVAIMNQILGSIQIKTKPFEQMRAVAKLIIEKGNGSCGNVPPISLGQFLIDSLTSTDDSRQGPSREDEELSLHAALVLLGSTPSFSEPTYPIHYEAIRRQKNDLCIFLLARYKDVDDKLGLVLDKILDPSLHRMYTHHWSNAAYILERDPVYLKYHKFHERPIYPYRDPSEKKPLKPIDMDEEELRKLYGGNSRPAAAVSQKDRGSDEGMQSTSSSSSSSCSEAQCPPVPYAYGLTNRNMRTWITNFNGPVYPNGDPIVQKKKMKRRIVHQLNPISSATEAQVFHMHELARRVLAEAGGSQSSVVFAMGQNIIGSTHRKLHLCAVIIAVYAMGMHNRISPSWNTRTYSNWASWIASQVQDVGPMAMEMIRETWTSHFTPSEIAGISDKASLSADMQMRLEGCRLALSVLPYAHSLKDEEIIRALEKCREDSRQMLISGLTAMDTQAFRQTAPTKALFIAMNHWIDLSAEEEADAMRNGVDMYPYMQQPQQQQYYGQPAQGPYVYPADQARIHQSQSAPQLVPAEVPAEMPPPMAPDEFVTPLHTTYLLNAFHSGLRGLDRIALTSPEDRQVYLRYCQHPPHGEDINKLYMIASKLGLQHMLMFFNTAARTVHSPFLLHTFAKESTKYFPHRSFCPLPIPQRNVAPQSSMAAPMQLLPQQPPGFAAPPPRYSNVKFCAPGVISGLFVQNGYHLVTGELFERACEQYLIAIVNKMNNPRFGINDSEDMRSFLYEANECFKWIPGPMSKNLFDDFVRTFKKQKTYKKEIANVINAILNSLC